MFIKKNLEYQKLPLPHKVSMSDFEMMSSIESFREYMLKRHTVRDFSKRSVDFAIIQKAIQIAGSAPSGANHQPWHFVAISNKDIKKTIREAAEIEENKFYSGGASDEWIKAAQRACSFAGYEIQSFYDVQVAEIMRFYNVYAFDDPYFYQTSSDGNQTVTYEKLSNQQSVEIVQPIPQLFLPEPVL